jgi:hypothetical protein
MAFRKPLPTPYDTDAEYWNIGELHFDFRENNVRVVMYGYATIRARNKKANPLGSAQTVIAGADFSPTLSRADIYTFMKANLPEFSAAEDV